MESASLVAAAVAPSAAPATVAFGLVAAVQLTTATSFLALGVVGVWPRFRGRAGWVLLAATLVLAAPEVVTGARFGNASGTLLSALRCAGALLLVLALTRGALLPGDGRDPRSVPALIAARFGSGGAAVIVPLGAALPVAVATGAAFLAAAVTAWPRPWRLRVPLVAGLLLHAVAALLAPAARTSSATATNLLLVRGVASLCLLAVLVVLARSSVLGRVATVIFAAVLLTATGAVAVAGTVANSTLERGQADTARRLHHSAENEFDGQLRRAENVARTAPSCLATPGGCGSLVPPGATLVGLQDGRMTRLSGPDDRLLLAALPRVPTVVASSSRGAPAARSGSEVVVLTGAPDRVLVVAVAPAEASGRRIVAVLGVDLRTLVSARSADLAVVLLPDVRFAASTFPADVGSRLAPLLRRSPAAATADPADPAVVAGLSGRGQVAVAPLGTVVPSAGSAGPAATAALVAGSRDDGLVQTQRAVLAGLFLALAATAVLVGLLGVALGAGVVRPVRRVTEAARRVRAGEQASAGPGGPDELGELARAFDAMTSSLTDAQQELRATAEREAALRSRLSTVVESLGDGLLVLDADGTVGSSNPAAGTLLGVDPVGAPVGSVLPEGDEVVVANGTGARYLSVSRTPLTDGAGVVVLLRDRTREREAERMKTEFLANVSHELRTPLTPVRGYAEILRRRSDAEPTEIAEHAGAIASAADRMSRVVDLLVDVAALDAGRVHPLAAAVAVGPFLDERLAEWRRRRPERAADLQVGELHRLPPVLVDERWLGKAVDEFVDNALKFAPAGRPVRLDGVRRSGRVVVGVQDCGPGLDRATRAVLYDDFAQADGSVTRDRDGLGLGLPFVRRVADLFDLELVVEADASGSFFGLSLPLAPRPSPGREQKAAVVASRGSSGTV